jgi:acyl-CoA synthetase (AMP-forming)/AMP-acid ligase II
MTLTLETLDDMAANHPEEIALAEQEQAISFAQLKRLVDEIGKGLFDHSASSYGQHIENETGRRILALCAAHAGVPTLVNISTSISKEGLSATLKAAHVQVLYTDLMDKLWQTANLYGPFISQAKPIDLHDRKIWRVQFRSGRSGAKIDEEEIKSRYRQRQESQTAQLSIPLHEGGKQPHQASVP